MSLTELLVALIINLGVLSSLILKIPEQVDLNYFLSFLGMLHFVSLAIFSFILLGIISLLSISFFNYIKEN